MEIVNVTHNDDHTAEMVVKLDKETLEQSLQKAARKISREYRFPGFRPGKAPYHVVEAAIGREAILAEVLEDLGDDMYREGLDKAAIEPYTLGEVKDINTDDGDLTITFTVAKRPVVNLKDYRDIRLDYEEDEVTDEQVNRGVEVVYNGLALTETVDRPAEFGDEVTITLHAFFAEEAQEGEEAQDEKDEHDPHSDNRDVYMHEHNYPVVLHVDEDLDAVMPGFSKEMVGVEAGNTREFSLQFTGDEDIHEDLRGKVIDFEVTVEKVSARILPVKNDFIATLASDGELNTLEELTGRVRESVEENIRQNSEQKYLSKVLDELMERAEILYPADMLEDYLDRSLEDMDEGLRRNYGLTLDDYLRIADKTKEEIREERREQAEDDVRTMLLLQQVATEEELFLDEAQLDNAIDKELARYGELAGTLRNILFQGEQRESFGSRVVSDRVTRRLISIAKGLNPPKGPDPEEDEEDGVSAKAEPGPDEAETVNNESGVAEE
ncbi:MAG: trigger factor [Chloroflexi bacterium]|nr:trigger factor [Chloroflexota bacterium]